MASEAIEGLFFGAAKSTCSVRNKNRGGKCHRPGPLMRNPYLNFLRDFRKQNCGLSVVEIVRKGAKEWNALPKDKKLRYIEEAFYAPKRHKSCCFSSLEACGHKRRKVSSCSSKKKRSRSSSCSSTKKRRSSRKKSLGCGGKRKSKKRTKKFKKSKCGQHKKLRKRKPKVGKSSCTHKAKKLKKIKKKRSKCFLF